MKKTLLVACGLWLAAFTTQAQNKTGYISLDNMVLLMPETAKIDSLLAQFEKDSLSPQLSFVLSEYQRKDSMYRDSLKTPPSVRKQLEQELQNYVYQINNWDSYKQQALQSKQNSLLEPIYSKVMKAIQEVSKEKGYSYVYSREALLVAPPADDIMPLVAEKLKVKLPPAAASKPTATGKPN